MLRVLAAVLCVFAGAAEARPFTPDDLLTLDRVADLQVAPDGRTASFTVNSPDLAKNGSAAAIWVIDLTARNAQPRRLLRAAMDESNARWAPDGRGVYFLSAKSGSSQIWFVPLAGGAPRQVTRLPLDVDTMKVSPDGKRLLASIEVFPDCPDLACTASRLAVRKATPATGRMFDRLFIRHWNRWKDGRQAHLFSIPLDASGRAGAPVDLSRLDADVIHPRGGDEDYTISPDGRRVVFTARIKGRDEAWSTNFDLYSVAADGSDAPVNLTKDNPAWDAAPVFSPDGKYLAWKAMDRPGNEADRFHLMLKDLATGAVRKIAADWDRSVFQFAFSSDGTSIVATTDHLGQHPLWRIDLNGGAPVLLQAKGTVTEFAIGGDQLVYGYDTIDAPVDLFRLQSNGTPERLTRFNEARMAKTALGAFEQFSFKGWNGEDVYAHVVQPVGYVPGRKYPVALVVHGGPQLSYGNGWSYRWNPQIFAGAGIAVLFIDFHGSTGYGQAFTDSITGDWGGKPLEDLKLGLKAATDRYAWLDESRVCAIGSSYSGFMMNWIQGNWPDRFRCLINQSGVFDTRGLYYETDEMWLDEFEFGRPQFENPAAYEKFNPVNLVSSWRTPMLIGHGEQDFNVPYAQGVSAFTALQRRGIESRLVIYPDEGHFIARPANALQWQREMIAWLTRFLQPESESKSGR